MSSRRTYWHLESSGRKPSDYTIGSSKLLYHVDRGFEVRTPVAELWERHLSPSGLRCARWESFDDPRATTYASYVAAQRDKEVVVEGLLAASEQADASLSPAWIEVLDEVLGTLRYPIHGLQMITAYLGSVAPSGKIAIAHAFQAADEMRRVQWIAYRMCALRARSPGLGEKGRARWQSAAHWQPLRELIERLLVTYDFGEVLVVLDGLLKPGLDGLFTHDLAEQARGAGDNAFAGILHSLGQDCAWHMEWSGALLRMAALESQHNRLLMATWLEAWRPRVEAALSALLPVLGTCSAEQHASFVRRLDVRLHAFDALLVGEPS